MKTHNRIEIENETQNTEIHNESMMEKLISSCTMFNWIYVIYTSNLWNFFSMCIYRNRIEEIKWNPNTNSVRFKHLEHLCDAGIKMNLIQNQIRFCWNPSSILRWCNVRFFLSLLFLFAMVCDKNSICIDTHFSGVSWICE